MRLLIKKFKPKNKVKDISFNPALSQLSHTLKNNLIAIRATAGNLKKNIEKNDSLAIENNLLSIDKMVTHAMSILEMTRAITQPIENPCLLTTFSISSCISETIQNYPFPSEKYSAYITTPTTFDFSIRGDRNLTMHIFNCLIKNTLDAIYTLGSGQATIALERRDRENLVCFKIPQALQMDENIFSLGNPAEPAHGFEFIQQAMNSMGGKVDFKAESNLFFVVTLSFLVQ